MMSDYLLVAMIAVGVSGLSFAFGMVCERIASDIERACNVSADDE